MRTKARKRNRSLKAESSSAVVTPAAADGMLDPLTAVPPAVSGIPATETPATSSIGARVDEDESPAKKGLVATEASLDAYPWKSHLNQFTQKYSLPLPIYETRCEGVPRSIQFRTSVHIGDSVHTSPTTSSQKKAAERSAAKFALETLSKKNQELLNEFPVTTEDAVMCKSVVMEFTEKSDMVRPSYKTDWIKADVRSGYRSSLTVDGESYVGAVALNKKDAEHSAAIVAVKSFLGRPEHEGILKEIILRKRRRSSIRFGLLNFDSNGAPDCESTGAIDIRESKRSKVETVCTTGDLPPSLIHPIEEPSTSVAATTDLGEACAV